MGEKVNPLYQNSLESVISQHWKVSFSIANRFGSERTCHSTFATYRLKSSRLFADLIVLEPKRKNISS